MTVTTKVMQRMDKLNSMGCATIIIRYTYNRKVDKLPTGFSVRPEDFDADAQRVKRSHKEYDKINAKILDTLAKMSKAETLLKEKGFEPSFSAVKELMAKIHNVTIKFWDGEREPETTQFIKQSIDELTSAAVQEMRDENALFNKLINQLPEATQNKNVKPNGLHSETLSYSWERFRTYSYETKNHNTAKRLDNNFRLLVAYINRYDLPQTFEVFDEDFFSGFKKYLLFESVNERSKEKKVGMLDTSAQNVIKFIVAWLNFGIKRGHHTNLAFKNWSTKKPETDLAWLTMDQIKVLIDADLKGAHAHTRDLWVFSAMTGLRYSDLKAWVKSNVQDDVIRLYTVKTNKLVTIPLNDVSRAILERYDGLLPVKNNCACNFEIKEILEKLKFNQVTRRTNIVDKKQKVVEKPLSQSITFHSARRSFINNFLRLNFSITEVSEMTGIDLRTLQGYMKKNEAHLKSKMQGVNLFA